MSEISASGKEEEEEMNQKKHVRDGNTGGEDPYSVRIVVFNGWIYLKASAIRSPLSYAWA